jgi:hypothetical protein
VLGSVIGRRILSLSEEHGLLLAQHMGARPGRSIHTALSFLVQQICATWQNKDWWTALLSYNKTRTFNRVVPAWLLHNMRERRISEWRVKWVGGFVINSTMTLSLPSYNTDTFSTYTSIPQCSLLLPVIFLFCHTNLVDDCNYHTSPCSGIGSDEDVNALAFDKTTDDNCRILQSLHKCCLG